MARPPAPGTRERIIDTATRLFYEQGVHAVGQQQLVDECGCGKNLLYREFASKDDIVVAYLERHREDWAALDAERLAPLAGDPRAQLLAVVRAATEDVDKPGFRGCPFQNVHAEFPDPAHPAHAVVVAHRDEVLARLRSLAADAGAPDPDQLASRLALIIDGVYANGAILGPASAAPAALAFADEIVTAAIP